MYRFLLALVFLSFLGTTQNTHAQIVKDNTLPDWLTRNEALTAGTLQVPENHDQPDGRQIHIAYAVMKAKEPVEGAFPMIFFSGGPGGETLDEGLVDTSWNILSGRVAMSSCLINGGSVCLQPFRICLSIPLRFWPWTPTLKRS